MLTDIPGWGGEDESRFLDAFLVGDEDLHVFRLSQTEFDERQREVPRDDHLQLASGDGDGR